MALDSYANLKTAVATFGERTADTTYTSNVDDFLDMAEATMSRILVNHHQLSKSTTLTTDSSGEVSLPSDYVTYKSVIWDDSWDLPLRYVTWDQLQYDNPYNVSGTPVRFSIQGTTIKVGPIKAGAFLKLIYSARLRPLDGTNTTNWLLTEAPDAYLLMTISAGHLFNENYEQAALTEGKATDMLEKVMHTGVVGQYGNVGIELRMSTP